MDWYNKQISDEMLSTIKKSFNIAYYVQNTKIHKTKNFQHEKNILQTLFYNLYQEFGLKAIVKIINEDVITYSRLRRIFFDLEIDIIQRTCTDDLKRVRSINAHKKQNFVDWTTKFRQERGIQGYYKNILGEYFWLRSSYEYAYAKYLNSLNLVWKAEERSFLLSTKQTYRPDFFVYDKNGLLLEIVEVKSMYFLTSQERLNKAILASQEFNFDLKIITQTELALIVDMKTILQDWKKERLTKKDIQE